MPAAVLEARLGTFVVYLPAEDAAVERGGLLGLVRGDAQVRDPSAPEDCGFAFVTWHPPILVGDALTVYDDLSGV